MSARHPLFDLSGRAALVTGASSGIGRALAGALAEAGAAVVLMARRRDVLEEAAGSIRDSGGEATAVEADLSDLATIEDVASRAAEAFGPPDILISAAGLNRREAAADVTLESWGETLRINLSVPFFLARALVPAMRQKGWGRIINIASLQSVRAFPRGIAYGASKGGVAQLTRAMAQEWSPDGITCNAIAPGYYRTELTAPFFADPANEAWAAGQTTMGRNGELQDLHGTAVFLSASASNYVTGQMIFVDGGFTAK